MSSHAWWTTERVAQLKQLWTQGESASTICALMKATSRCAIIGKARRLGLVQGNNPRRTTRPRTRWGAQLSRLSAVPKSSKERVSPTVLLRASRSGASKENPSAPPKPMVVLVEPPSPLLVTFGELKDGICKFPFGDKAPFRYCGHKAMPGTSWCPHHRSVCFEKKTWKDVDRIAGAVRGPMGLNRSIVTGMW